MGVACMAQVWREIFYIAMASKTRSKKQKEKTDTGCEKLSKFFKPDTSRKRYCDSSRGVKYEPLSICRPRGYSEPDIPSPKRFSPPSVAFPPSVTPTPSPEPGSSLSQEDRLKMQHKKLEAESKQTARRFGAEQLGLSWFKALQQEFKKPYMQMVRSQCSDPSSPINQVPSLQVDQICE